MEFCGKSPLFLERVTREKMWSYFSSRCFHICSYVTFCFTSSHQMSVRLSFSMHQRQCYKGLGVFANVRKVVNNTFLIRLLILRERKFLAAKAKAFCRRTIWDKDFLCLATILFTTSETTERGQYNHQDWSLLLWHHCIAAMQRWQHL